MAVSNCFGRISLGTGLIVAGLLAGTQIESANAQLVYCSLYAEGWLTPDGFPCTPMPPMGPQQALPPPIGAGMPPVGPYMGGGVPMNNGMSPMGPYMGGGAPMNNGMPPMGPYVGGGAPMNSGMPPMGASPGRQPPFAVQENARPRFPRN
jgi:hypothetical protein